MNFGRQIRISCKKYQESRASIQKLRARKRLLGRALSMIILTVIPACGTVRIARPDHWNPKSQAQDKNVTYEAANNAFAVSSPATNVQRRSVWVRWWGWDQQNVDPRDCLGDGLAEVEISRNLGDDLVSVITFGCFHRYTIEWRCAKQNQQTDGEF